MAGCWTSIPINSHPLKDNQEFGQSFKLFMPKTWERWGWQSFSRTSWSLVPSSASLGHSIFQPVMYFTIVFLSTSVAFLLASVVFYVSLDQRCVSSVFHCTNAVSLLSGVFRILVFGTYFPTAVFGWPYQSFPPSPPFSSSCLISQCWQLWPKTLYHCWWFATATAITTRTVKTAMKNLWLSQPLRLIINDNLSTSHLAM